MWLQFADTKFARVRSRQDNVILAVQGPAFVFKTPAWPVKGGVCSGVLQSKEKMAPSATTNYSQLPGSEDDNCGQDGHEALSSTETSSSPVEGPTSIEDLPSPGQMHEADNDSARQPPSGMERPRLQQATNCRPVEQLQDSRQRSSLSAFKRRMQVSIRPSLHEFSENNKSSRDTMTEFRRSRQRNRLLRLTIGEWVNTLVLCVTYFGILFVFSRKVTISVPERRVFNALITGNSLLLGVNLAASLRSYAKLVRWRMLAVCYRPLETFDLVMGCDSLMNVVQLIWKAPDVRHIFFPSRTQILCVLWLLVHLAITILVGIIGLNYNLDTSADFVLLENGRVSILDPNALSTGNYLMDLSTVQAWGVAGEITQALGMDEPFEFTLTYYSSYDGHTLYYFQDWNAEDPQKAIQSTRYIESYASCDAYKVVEGQYGNLSYVVYDDGEKTANQSLPAAPGPGGLLMLSMLNSTCGPRCADIKSFQAASIPTNAVVDAASTKLEGRFFLCTNNVTQVGDDTRTLPADYLVSDLAARMLAGAVGWSDNPPALDGQALSETYTNFSSYGFFSSPNAADMADAISSFTMGAIAIMDGSEVMTRKNVSDSRMPVDAQILHVQWRYAGAILAVIPFIHFWTLMVVIVWANKAVIKDDSHLAIAKLYHTLLLQLGDRGCLLRGDEIVRTLHNPEVAYGWRPSHELDGVMHVDVFEKGCNGPRADEPFVEGWYDGDGSDEGLS